MSVLLLSHGFPPRIGGSCRYLWEIYRRLDPSDVLVATGSSPEGERFDRSQPFPIIRAPLRFATWGVTSLSGVAGYHRLWQLAMKAIRQHPVSHVHCGRFLPEGLVGWLLKLQYRLPYVCYAYGEELKYAAGSRELTFLMKRVLSGSDYVIAISRNTERILQVEWGLPASQIRLLFPGVDTSQFVPATYDANARRRLGWSQRPVLLTVGRLQKRKGHDMVIRALAAIRKVIPEVLYAIIGDGEERESLEQLVRTEGHSDHVVFHGELGEVDMLSAYQQCNLFVLANRQVGQDIEGFGMVLLEAQACGRPVIAGDSGGTAETMRVPETGRLVDCEAPAQLADAVLALLSDTDQLQRMGHAAREWVTGNFDWTIVSQRALQIFRQTLDRTSRKRLTLPKRTLCT